MTQPQLPPFATIYARARSASQLSAAEFSYSLAGFRDGDTRAVQAIDNAIYAAATAHLPAVEPGNGALDDRWAARDAAREHYRAEWDDAIEQAKGRSYDGWSTASRGPIRFAD